MARLDDGTPLSVRLQNSAGTTIPAAGARVGLAFESGAARPLAD